ncbi:MAG: hypothetical protein HYZ58_08510 [Acidobacteria bacterium]|nr:hypothetical protein [Acidobacteriota bacterium]MBI3263180.1 hypothetical protein [Acidobacteriota bacterium]
MRIFRWSLIQAVVASSVVLGLGLALTRLASAQQPPPAPEKRKLSKEQQKDVQTLIGVVDKGQPAPADVQLSWDNDFLKAQEGRTYVPFTITIPQGTFATSSVAMYLRVVSRSAAPAAPASGEKRDEKKKDDKKADAQYAFEDIHFLQLPGTKPLPTPAAGAPGAAPAMPAAAASGKPVDIRVSRAFAVTAGDYDVYIALKDQGEDKKGQPPQKTALLRHPLTVPNYWSGELTTSTVIMAEKVEPMTAAVSQEQQAENPYVLGSTKITPATSTKFPKSADLSVIFIVYNTGLDAAKKPDVTVEYSFHRKAQEGEKFFNKTQPQTFNASTLPPQFDLSAGHQLVAGQSVPLASFPEGDYRLEIKITDNVSKKSLTRELTFTVGTGTA